MKRILCILEMVCLMFAGLNVQAQDGLITKQIVIEVSGNRGLAQQISQTKKDLITNLMVTGTLSEEDMAFLRSMNNLRILDLTGISSKSSSLCFKRCASLESVKLPRVDCPNYDCGWVTMTDSCFLECRKLRDVNLCDYACLSNCAFMGCSCLERINMNSSSIICYVGRKCFYGSKIKNFTARIASLVDEYRVYSVRAYNVFEYECFSGCEELTEINLSRPGNFYAFVCFLPSAFDCCANLETVRVTGCDKVEFSKMTLADSPKLREVVCNNCTSVICDTSSFENCKNLQMLRMNECSIRNRAFAGCVSLKSLSLNDVGIGSEAFAGCVSLKSLSLSDFSVIRSGAFAGCTSLNAISLSGKDGYDELASGAFAGCNDFALFLTETTPPTINVEAFDRLSSNCILYVPNGTYDAYWLSPWGDIFANIKEYDATGVKRVTHDGQMSYGTYSLDGTVFKDGERGISIERNVDGKTRKVLRK